MKFNNFFFSAAVVAIALFSACGDNITNDPLSFKSGEIWLGVGGKNGNIDRVVKYDYEAGTAGEVFNLSKSVEGSLQTIDDQFNEAIILAAGYGDSGNNNGGGGGSTDTTSNGGTSDSTSLRTTTPNSTARMIFLNLADGSTTEVSKFPLNLYPENVYDMEYLPLFHKTYVMTNHGHYDYMKLFSIDRNSLDTISGNSSLVWETGADSTGTAGDLDNILQNNSIFIGANIHEDKLLLGDTTNGSLYEYYTPTKKLDAITTSNGNISSGLKLQYSPTASLYVGVKVSATSSSDSNSVNGSDLKLNYVTLDRSTGAYNERSILNMDKSSYAFDYESGDLSVNSVIDESAQKLIVVLPKTGNTTQIAVIDIANGGSITTKNYNSAVSGIAKVKNK